MSDDWPVTPPTPQRSCPNGHEVAPDAAFCPTCGASVAGASTATHPPGDPVAERSRRKRGGRLWIIALAAVVVIGGGAAALLLLRSGDSTKTVTATLIITDHSLATAGCTNSDSIDVGDQTEVTVSRLDTDEAPAKVGKAMLGSSTPDGDMCTYHFSFEKVPSDADQYRFDLPSTSFTKSRQELSSSSWQADFHWGPKTTTLSGDLVLHDAETAGLSCVGQGGYGDIQFGAAVVVSDQNGDILSSGSLGFGSASDGECTYHFTLSNVRTDEDQYAVEISHRGKVVESAAQLRDNGWSFGLSLGQLNDRVVLR